jgi:hypothetical protein
VIPPGEKSRGESITDRKGGPDPVTERKALMISLITAAVFFACGEPLERAPFGWVRKGETPMEYNPPALFGAGPSGVYMAARTADGEREVLLVYKNGSFAENYSLPAEKGDINDAAFSGNVGFLSVSRFNGTWLDACLEKRSGSAWAEVIRTNDYDRFKNLTPVDGDTCWLIAGARVGPPHIAKYDHGVLTVTAETTSALSLRPLVYCRDLGMIFNLVSPGNSTSNPVLSLTADDGATWHREIIPDPAPYDLKTVVDVAGTGAALYLAADVIVPGVSSPYRAVIKRTGGPGEGVYELSYFGWVGPGSLNLDALAFRADGVGVGVGTGGSLYFDGTTWVREITDPFFGFNTTNLITDPNGGFWCTETFDERGFLWHP